MLHHREPPSADPHAGWCGGRGLNTPGYPIGRRLIDVPDALFVNSAMSRLNWGMRMAVALLASIAFLVRPIKRGCGFPEATHRADLHSMREALAHYVQDHGELAPSLQELVVSGSKTLLSRPGPEGPSIATTGAIGSRGQRVFQGVLESCPDSADGTAILSTPRGSRSSSRATRLTASKIGALVVLAGALARPSHRSGGGST